MPPKGLRHPDLPRPQVPSLLRLVAITDEGQYLVEYKVDGVTYRSLLQGVRWRVEAPEYVARRDRSRTPGPSRRRS